MSNASDFIIENGVLKKYVGPGGDVVIPEGVTEIGEDAFCEAEQINGYTLIAPNDSITSVFLPNGLKKIGIQAFRGHISLTQIEFPRTLKTIESGAFWGCGLEEIIIPRSVAKIETDAFRFVEPKRVIIQGNAKIGKNAFASMGKWDRFLAGEQEIRFEVPNDMATIPLFLDWDELYPALKTKFIHSVLNKEFLLRPADVKYVISRFMASKQTLVPEIMVVLTLKELKTLEENDAITAVNADYLLELLSDNIECRTELIEYISTHITDQQRESVEQKSVNNAVLKTVKRNRALEAALEAFQKTEPAEIKKLWKCTAGADGLRIEKYNGTEVAIVIPSEIGGKPVVELAPDAMRAAAKEPGCKKSTYNKKMYKNKAVIIMEGIKRIGESAFAGCVYMTDLCLPISVAKISPDAFDDCHKLTIHAPAGSYAETYAKENNIPFVAE